MRELKIIYTSQTPIGDKSGGSIHLRDLSKAYVKLGYEVTVLVPDKSRYEYDTTYKIEYIKVPDNKLFKLLIFEIKKFIYLFQFRKSKEHVIYARRSSLNMAESFMALFFNKTFILEENHMPFFGYDSVGNFSTKVKNYIGKKVTSFMYNSADAIICVSNGVKEDIETKLNISEKLYVVNNGVDLDLFYPEDIDIAKEKLNLSKTDRYLCYVGNFYQPRGIQYLIEALPKIKETIPTVKLLLIGDGPYKKELDKLSQRLEVESEIIFTGLVDDFNVGTYINASDCCIAPYDSTYKNISFSPLKLGNYFGCKKPVIISDLDYDFEVEPDALCVFFEVENSDSLSKAVVKVLNNGKLANELAQNGYKYAIEYMSWDITAKKIIDIAKKLKKKK